MKVTTQLIVRIAPKLKRDLARVAKKRGTSMQAEVEAAIIERLEKTKPARTESV